MPGSTPTSRTSRASCTPCRMIRAAADNVRDLVSGYGEIWSTRLFARLSAGARQASPGPLARCARGAGGGVGPAGAGRAVGGLQGAGGDDCRLDGTLIITGFIASTPEGLQTTLGRNGSDFSASIFGALLDAEEIVIWTDVDGVLSADPRRVPEAQGHRLAVLQRGDGTRLLRRQGHPSADHGAGGRSARSRSGSATPSRRKRRAR